MRTLLAAGLVAGLTATAPDQSPDRPAALLHVAQDPAGKPDYRAYRNTQAVTVTTRAVLAAALRKPGILDLRMVKAQDDPGAWLRDNLEVDFPLDGEVLRIRLRGGNPKEAAALVNAVAESYLAQVTAADPVARDVGRLKYEAVRHQVGLILKRDRVGTDEVARMEAALKRIKEALAELEGRAPGIRLMEKAEAAKP